MNSLASDNLFITGIIGSLLAGIATGIGALPIIFTKKISDRVIDILLGFSAGVMLAATAFSLILPAIEFGGGGTRGILLVALGIIMGAIFLDLVDKFSPHLHTVLGNEGHKSTLSRVWLFVIAIAIHNFPEGLAVGVGFGSGNTMDGIVLAIGIGLQNMPEGLAVALPLLREGYSKTKAFIIALATGLVELAGGIIGISIVQFTKPILPIGLAFAAGAMLFVISDEIIPETHSRGYQRLATYGIIVGFIVMMVLDSLFA